MNKSSNIKAKSGRLMVNINRAILKCAFGLGILTTVIVYFIGLDFTNGALIFAGSSSVIFGLSYAICYYIYKYYNKTKTEAIKKDPLLAQIKICTRILGFITGLIILCLGANALHNDNLWGLVGIIGIIPLQTLLVSTKLMSHLSTGFENLGAGIFFCFVYYSVIVGLDLFALLFFGLTLVCLVLQEVFYYFFDIKKHDREHTTTKELILIRTKYFSRNAMLYVILYVLVALLVYSTLIHAVLSSDILNIIIQAIPLIISIISIALALMQTFDSNSQKEKKPDYNQVIDIDKFKKDNKDKFTTNFAKSLDYCLNTLNTQNGHIRAEGIDYYYHCVNVANILKEQGKTNDDLLCTALLHDCIEDIEDCTKETIKNLTNEHVAHSVALLTKAPDIDYKLPENTKKYLDKILTDENASLVKIADRLHNMSTLKNVSPEKATRKINETKSLFLPFLERALIIYPDHTAFWLSAKEFFLDLKY